MAKIHKFRSGAGDVKIITENIDWDYVQWYVKGNKKLKYSSMGKMPIGEWCTVKSYEYEMGGVWMLEKID